MMAERRQRLREYSHGNFVRAVEAFNEGFSRRVDSSTMKLLAEDVEKSWKQLEDNHRAYIASEELDIFPTNDAEDVWIGELQKRHREVRIRALKYSRRLHKNRIEDRINELEKSFQQIVEDMRNLLNDDQTYPSEETEKPYGHYDNFLSDLESKQLKTRTPPNTPQDHRTLPKINNHNSTNGYQQTQRKRGHSPATLLPPFPHFDGDPFSYQRFKGDCMNFLMMNNIRDGDAAQVLRSCLSTDVASSLPPDENRVEKLLMQLDAMYAIDSTKSAGVEKIINDVRMLVRLPERSPAALMQFVNTIEKSFTDLKFLNSEKELTNPYMVKEIENKLPRDVAVRWYRKVYEPFSKIDKDNRFPELLSHLKMERDVCENGCMNNARAQEHFYNKVRNGGGNHPNSNAGNNQLLRSFIPPNDTPEQRVSYF